MLDLLIRNADIVDGTGRPAFRGDLAVRDGRIVEVGHVSPGAPARETLDAALPAPDSRLTLAPGFIDIHTHADIALLARPEHTPKGMQGVTTEVFSNCGGGFAPITAEGLEIQRRYSLALFGDDTGVAWDWRSVADLLARYEAQGVGANVAYLVPHGAVRVSVMGMAARPADAGEVAQMVQMVEEGMEQGAWGLSTGLWYAPMSSAGREEIVALARAAGFFATHQRDYGEDTVTAATEESLSIAREAGVPVQISHLQINGWDAAGRSADLLALLDRAVEDGVDATCDSYPYTAGSTFVQALLPAWATDGGPDALLGRLDDPETRPRITAALREGGWRWERFALAGAASAENGPLEGRTFAEAAEARGLDVSEWICALLREDGLRACYVCHAQDEGNVRDIMRWPRHMVGSDGLHLPGACHPRLYGTFPRVLGRYVREEKVLTREEAVRKMTSAPAARLGLRDRGTLAPGMAADLVLFDPATVRDTATYADPRREPEGIPHVWVNGVAVKHAGRPTGARPGQVLRRE